MSKRHHAKKSLNNPERDPLGIGWYDKKGTLFRSKRKATRSNKMLTF